MTQEETRQAFKYNGKKYLILLNQQWWTFQWLAHENMGVEVRAVVAMECLLEQSVILMDISMTYYFFFNSGYENSVFSFLYSPLSSSTEK